MKLNLSSNEQPLDAFAKRWLYIIAMMIIGVIILNGYTTYREDKAMKDCHHYVDADGDVGLACNSN